MWHWVVPGMAPLLVVVGVSLHQLWLNWCQGDHLGSLRDAAADRSQQSLVGTARLSNYILCFSSHN